jgi:uncharacterized protein with GYD domain
MSMFFMFGTYSSESVRKISKERTKEILEIVNKFGGEISAMYVLLGAYDLVLIANFADMKIALQASIAMTRATGISFSTLPAISVEEFDEMMGNKE